MKTQKLDKHDIALIEHTCGVIFRVGEEFSLDKNDTKEGYKQFLQEVIKQLTHEINDTK